MDNQSNKESSVNEALELGTELYCFPITSEPEIGYCCPTCSKTVPIHDIGSITVTLPCPECMSILKDLIKERRNLNQQKR